MRATLLALCAAGSLAVGCSMSDDAALAEAEVARFHEAFNSQRFDGLYENGAKELKAAAGKEDFVKLLRFVHRKLGTVSASDKLSWHVNYQTGGTFVTLVYDTTFTNGKGREQFVYKVSGDQALLVGFHVNSKELIPE
jgi:hypothetical protein